jgi:hypothetical protein
VVAAAGKIEGDIRINGHPKEQSSFARVSGYVEQFDTHTAAATVKEALLFSGTLRNGRDVDMKTTQDFVQQVRPASVCSMCTCDAHMLALCSTFIYRASLQLPCAFQFSCAFQPQY